MSKEIHDMSWDEFKDLLVGLSPETPLGRIVSIRAEENREILKHFTPEQNRIRWEWRNKKAKKVSTKELGAYLEAIKQQFIQMSGGEHH